ncbi:hypothetical protein [Paenibacillus sp. TY11]|uniref:hypothetical protein n=1 Tax=Paenibacillus sp. TY11 TaxID=3448633 RepID=UPI0040395B2B
MAKIIDVTLATMQSVGTQAASPLGAIRCSTVRAVNDKERHQIELLYYRGDSEQPMHPSGKRFLLPGESLTFNVTKRLTVHSEDEMLMFDYDLNEKPSGPDDRGEIYQGSDYRKVRFEELDGFQTISCSYGVVDGGGYTKKINVIYTVNLISG